MGAYRTALEALSPTAYWRLDETSGTTAADSVGTFDGTYTGSYTLNEVSAIQEGTAVSTNHASEGGIILPAGLEPGTSEWCFVAGIKFSGNDTGFGIRYVDGSTVGPQVIISSGASGPGYITCRNTTDSLQTVVTLANTYNDDEWHHIVCQRRNTGSGWKQEIYVDGTLENDQTLPTVENLNSSVTDRTLFYASVVANRTLTGTMDEVAFFKNAALTPSQVSTLYSSFIIPIEVDLSLNVRTDEDETVIKALSHSGLSTLNLANTIVQDGLAIPIGILTLSGNQGVVQAIQTAFESNNGLSVKAGEQKGTLTDFVSSNTLQLTGDLGESSLRVLYRDLILNVNNILVNAGKREYNGTLTLDVKNIYQPFQSETILAELLLNTKIGSLLSPNNDLFTVSQLDVLSGQAESTIVNFNSELQLQISESINSLGSLSANVQLLSTLVGDINNSSQVAFEALSELQGLSSPVIDTLTDYNLDSSLEIDVSLSGVSMLPFPVGLSLNITSITNSLVDRIIGTTTLSKNRRVFVLTEEEKL